MTRGYHVVWPTAAWTARSPSLATSSTTSCSSVGALRIATTLTSSALLASITTLAALSATASARSSDLPKSPRALSVRVRQLAPQLRSIGIDVEFRREANGRFMTVAMTEGEDRSEGNCGCSLIDKRLRAYSDQENRAIG
jgi:hypothetical protein